MFTKFRKNKRGFSLVELIIVIAIMVALVAVMAPNFIRYVKRSHDAVVTSAAEDCVSFVKAEYADGTLTGQGTISVYSKNTGNGVKHIVVEWQSGNNFSYKDLSGTAGEASFSKACGVDSNKTVKSDLVYNIIIGDSIAAHAIEVETTHLGG